MSRVLILSWEYPPLIEGGLARHVRKLSEGLVELGVEVHVLTRGNDESPRSEVAAGVNVHRVLEPSRPRDLGDPPAPPGASPLRPILAAATRAAACRAARPAGRRPEKRDAEHRR